MLRCDGVFRHTRCNRLLAEVCVVAAGRVVIRCERCGKRHEVRGEKSLDTEIDGVPLAPT